VQATDCVLQLEQAPQSIIAPTAAIHVGENFTALISARDAYGNLLTSGTVTINLLRARCCGVNGSLIYVPPSLNAVSVIKVGGDGYALARISVETTCDELYCQSLPAKGYVMEFAIGASRLRTNLFTVGADQIPVDFELDVVGVHTHTNTLAHTHAPPVHVAGAMMSPAPRALFIDQYGNRGVEQNGDDVWLWQVDYTGQGCLPCRVKPPCGALEQRNLSVSNSTCTALQQNVGGALVINIPAPSVANDDVRFTISITNWDVKGMLRRVSLVTDRIIVVPAEVVQVLIIDQSEAKNVQAGQVFTMRAVLMDASGNSVLAGSIVAEIDDPWRKQLRPFPDPFCLGCLTTVDVARPENPASSVYIDPVTRHEYKGVALLQFNITEMWTEFDSIRIRLTHANSRCTGPAVPAPVPANGEPQKLFKCAQYSQTDNIVILHAEFSQLQVESMPAEVVAGQGLNIGVTLRDAYGNLVWTLESSIVFSIEVYMPAPACNSASLIVVDNAACPGDPFASYYNGTLTPLGLTYFYTPYMACFPCACDGSTLIGSTSPCSECGATLGAATASTACMSIQRPEFGYAALDLSAPVMQSLPEGVPLILRATEMRGTGISPTTIKLALPPLRINTGAPTRFVPVDQKLEFALLGELALPQPQLLVTDMYGNPVAAGVKVTIGVEACGDAMCTAQNTVYTNASGVAVFQNLTFTGNVPGLMQAGMYSLTYTTTGGTTRLSEKPIRIFRFGGLQVSVQPSTSLVNNLLKVTPVVSLCATPPPCDPAMIIPAYERPVHVRLYDTSTNREVAAGMLLQEDSTTLNGVYITNGTAVFNGLKVTQAGGRLALRFFFASGTPPSSVQSEAFSVTTLQTVRIGITAPTLIVAGETFTARTDLLDFKDTVSTRTITDVKMSLDPTCSVCRNVSLEGAVLTKRTASGTASFDLVVKKAMSGAILRADASTGILAFDLISIPSGTLTLTVVHAKYSQLRILRQPGDGSSGERLSTQPVLELYDRFDNLCVLAQVYLSALVDDPLFSIDDGARVTNGSIIPAVQGVFTFTDLVVSVCGQPPKFQEECGCANQDAAECAEDRTLSMTVCVDKKCDIKEIKVFTEPINIRMYALLETPFVDWDAPEYGILRVYAGDPVHVSARLMDENAPPRLVSSNSIRAVLSIMSCAARIASTSITTATAVRGVLAFDVQLDNSACVRTGASITYNKTACKGCIFNVTSLTGLELSAMSQPFTVPEGPIYGTEVTQQPTGSTTSDALAVGPVLLLRDSDGAPGDDGIVYAELVGGIFGGGRANGTLSTSRRTLPVVAAPFGQALFTDLTVSAPGQGYVLRFTRCPRSAALLVSAGVCKSDSGVGRQWFGVYSSVDSRPFDISNTEPASLVQYPGDTWRVPTMMLAGVPFSPAVRLFDSLNFAMTSRMYIISATLLDSSGVNRTAAYLQGNTVSQIRANYSRSDAGVAYFTDLAIKVPGEGWALAFNVLDPSGAPMRIPVTTYMVRNISSTHGAASQLVVLRQPTMTLQGVRIYASNSSVVSVAVLDALGNQVTCRAGSSASTAYVRAQLAECTLDGSPSFSIEVEASGGCLGERPPGVFDCGGAPLAGRVGLNGTLRVRDVQGAAEFVELTVTTGVHALRLMFKATGVNVARYAKVRLLCVLRV
jgi:hypothetical protein